MSLIPIDEKTFHAYDNETRQILLCTGDLDGDYRVLGPLVQAVQESRTLLKVVAGPSVVTVTSTTSTLSTLGLPLHSQTKALTLIPHGAGIYWNGGGASTSTATLVPISELGIEKGLADSLQFYAAANTNMTVIQHAVWE